MRIYRPKYRDRKGRKKQTRTFWVEFRGPDRQVRKFSLGTTDEDVAVITKTQLSCLNEWAKKELNPPDDLVKWVRRQEPKLREKIYEAGLLRAEQASNTKPLIEHLTDYIKDLRINSENNYPDQVESRLKRILSKCSFVFWADVEGIKVNEFISELISNGMSRHTGQHYVTNFKMFCHWLKEQGRIKELPVIKSIKYIVPPQRAFEEEELEALYEAARRGPEIYGLTGHARYVLYKLAFVSGLRRSELASLTRNSFDFERGIVFVPGESTKNDNEAYQKITPEVAALVKDLAKEKMPDAKLFEISNNSAGMIREDCKVAGIQTTNWKGTIEFKSLRSSLATHLAKKGVPMHIVQQIMRHASIKTTARYYLKILGGDTADAISKLRGFGEKQTKQQTA